MAKTRVNPLRGRGGCPFTPKTLDVRCADCEWKGTVGECPWPPTDYLQRVEAGGEVPAGECPECGCLAYLLNAEQKADDQPMTLICHRQFPTAQVGWGGDVEFLAVNREWLYEVSRKVLPKAFKNVPVEVASLTLTPDPSSAVWFSGADLPVESRDFLRTRLPKDHWRMVPSSLLTGVVGRTSEKYVVHRNQPQVLKFFAGTADGAYSLPLDCDEDVSVLRPARK